MTFHDSGTPEKQDLLSILHRTACILFTVLAAWCLLRCCLAVSLSLQDLRKYGGLGFSYPFTYYLKENYFLENVVMFVCVAAELGLYILQCRRAEECIPFRGSIPYFSLLLVIHVGLCLHACSLPRPEFFPSTPAEEAIAHYHYWATLTVAPSITYFILYLLRIRR